MAASVRADPLVKIDILGSPVTWAQALIGRAGTENQDSTPVSSAGVTSPPGDPVPPEGVLSTGLPPSKEQPGALDEDFCSPNPRPFPHSNRRSERVARQKRDLAQQDETPGRGPLKRKKKIRQPMAGVQRTPTKPPQGVHTADSVQMETDAPKEPGLSDIHALLVKIDGRMATMDSRMATMDGTITM